MVRLRKTRHELLKLGVSVEYSDSLTADLRKFDLVHVWQSMHPDSFRQGANARQQEVPYVVSPIVHDFDRMGLYNSAGLPWRLLKSAVGGQAGLRMYKAWIEFRKHANEHWQEAQKLMAGSALLVPTSHYEAGFIESRYGVARGSVKVVPNALDADVFQNAKSKRFSKEHGLENFVLIVARVELCKNHLNLVRALAGTGRELVAIGSVKERAYFRRCRETAGRLGVPFHHVKHVKQDVVADAMAAAAVHVLPSWTETTGQTSLQAAAAGCPVVVTVESPWQEYFGKRITVCKPESPASIREAIGRAENQPLSYRHSLARRMHDRFTWERAGRETLAAYRKALGTSR